MQLQQNIEAFDEAGLNIVLVTYDSPELQQAFIDRHNITFPVMSDQDAATVKALGILNEDYVPGDSNYGIPYPGIFIVDADMTVQAKIFVEKYAERVTSDGVLAVARQALNL